MHTAGSGALLKRPSDMKEHHSGWLSSLKRETFRGKYRSVDSQDQSATMTDFPGLRTSKGRAVSAGRPMLPGISIIYIYTAQQIAYARTDFSYVR